MKKIIKLQDAKCTSFELSAPVFFAADEDGVGENFKIEAYTGEIVDRWWGKLAVDVDGITAAQNMPVLRDHNPKQIVGYSQKSWKDGSFFVAGKFSKVTADAGEVKALAAEGFPWQASIGVRPIKIMSLEQDGEAEVNGKTVKGPAEVWLESQVFETSFVSLAADGNTAVSTFSKIEEVAPEHGEGPSGAQHKPKKGEKMKITLALLEKDAPELLAEIRQAAKAEGLTEGVAKGSADELGRIKAVSEQSMIGHETLISSLMFDGKTTGPEAAVQVLAAEKRIRDTALENLGTDGVTPVEPGTPTEPAPKPKPGEVLTKEEFAADEKLSAEFNGDFGVYQACIDAEKKGLIRSRKN